MTNRLASQQSAYLLQHAEQPVDWFPWGDEALALAKRQDKPILLSIGDAACHWCHVMARESFSDPAIATLINDGFVNIKADREQRLALAASLPRVDQTAVLHALVRAQASMSPPPPARRFRSSGFLTMPRWSPRPAAC